MSQQEEYISKLSLYLFWDIDITKADMDTQALQETDTNGTNHTTCIRIWTMGRLAINSFLLWIGQNRINMQVITHP